MLDNNEEILYAKGRRRGFRANSLEETLLSIATWWSGRDFLGSKKWLKLDGGEVHFESSLQWWQGWNRSHKLLQRSFSRVKNEQILFLFFKSSE